MYLELLDINKIKQGQKTRKKNMIMSKKKCTKEDWENVRSTWLDHMASEGIQ